MYAHHPSKTWLSANFFTRFTVNPISYISGTRQQKLCAPELQAYLCGIVLTSGTPPPQFGYVYRSDWAEILAVGTVTNSDKGSGVRLSKFENFFSTFVLVPPVDSNFRPSPISTKLGSLGQLFMLISNPQPVFRYIPLFPKNRPRTPMTPNRGVKFGHFYSSDSAEILVVDSVNIANKSVWVHFPKFEKKFFDPFW